MPEPDLQDSILRLAHHYTEASDLFVEISKKHPGASKKEIVLAALDILIEAAGSDDGIARRLHRLITDGNEIMQAG